MFYQKMTLVKCIRFLGIGLWLTCSYAHGGVENVLTRLGVQWERQEMGESKVPVYVVTPFVGTPNRNHWDDLVVHPEGRPADAEWRGIVNHYTVCDFEQTVRLFTADIPDNRVSAHFVIAEKDEALGIDGGEIIHIVPLKSRAWHAGVSGWGGINGGGLKGVNACFLGIEHVNQGFVLEGQGRKYFPYDPNQIKASIALSRELMVLYPQITSSCVVGHDDITERKQDPGPLFPWDEFYQGGVGASLSPEELDRSMIPLWTHKEPLPQGPSAEFQLTYMQRYGYDLDPTQGLTPKNIALIEAFRGHFPCNKKPERVPLAEGKISVEDMAWVSGLVAKYRS